MIVVKWTADCPQLAQSGRAVGFEQQVVEIAQPDLHRARVVALCGLRKPFPPPWRERREQEHSAGIGNPEVVGLQLPRATV